MSLAPAVQAKCCNVWRTAATASATCRALALVKQVGNDAEDLRCGLGDVSFQRFSSSCGVPLPAKRHDVHVLLMGLLPNRRVHDLKAEVPLGLLMKRPDDVECLRPVGAAVQ